MTLNIIIKVILICFICFNMWGAGQSNDASPKIGPQIATKVGNPAGLLCWRIWYSVRKIWGARDNGIPPRSTTCIVVNLRGFFPTNSST